MKLSLGYLRNGANNKDGGRIREVLDVLVQVVQFPLGAGSNLSGSNGEVLGDRVLDHLEEGLTG